MLLLFVVLNVVTILHAKPANQSKIDDELSSRIWYGLKADIKDFPYFAALPHLCGAVIISEDWLVTAAHCVDTMMSNLVWVGGTTVQTSQLYTFDHVVVHPHYSHLPIKPAPVNDIALLRLSKPLEFSETVQPVNLPSMNYELDFGAVYKFAGKGQDQTNQTTRSLMRMNVRVLQEEECLSYIKYPEYLFFKSHFDQIKDVTICAKRMADIPGANHGDSGSPLVLGNTLVGIASYLPHSDYVTMYTNVAYFADWIHEVTGVSPDYEDYVSSEDP